MAENNKESAKTIFGWTIDKKLGAGTYGTVYRVYKEEHEQRVYYALKHITIPKSELDVEELRRTMDEDGIREYYANLARRFENEIAAMEKLSGCKNVVQLEESRVIKLEDGIGYDIYILMELLSDSQKYIKAHWSEAEVVKLGKDVCNALIACSAEGIIHRDIKPANILVDIDGDEAVYKLADFGIAKQLSTATVSMTGGMGTPGYMAYEEYLGSGYGDRRTLDICSLGLVLYQLLNSNRLPFLPTRGNYTPEQRELAIKKRFAGYPLEMPCNASVGLANVVLKACAYKPEDRYQNAEELLYALENYSEDGEIIEPTLPIAPSVIAAPKKRKKEKKSSNANAKGDKKDKNGIVLNKKPILIAAASAVAVAALGGVVLSAASTNKPDDSRRDVYVSASPSTLTMVPIGSIPPIINTPASNTPDGMLTDIPDFSEHPVITNDPIAYSQGPGATQVPVVSGDTSTVDPIGSPAWSPVGTQPPVVTPGSTGAQTPQNTGSAAGDTPPPTPIGTATQKPTNTPTAKPTNSTTPRPTNTPTPKPTTPRPTNTPTPKPTTPRPTNTPTPKPTTPKPTVTPTPTPKPTTPKPTVTPTPTPIPTPTTVPAVHFNSAAFENALRRKYNLNGTITNQMLLSFTELDLRNCGLTDISDVAKFKNITKLILIENNITSINAVAGLTKLTVLRLGNNRITNVSPLQNMTWLQKLYLDYNNISNVAPLMRLVGLKTIWLYGNPIPQNQIDALRAALVNCTEFGW